MLFTECGEDGGECAHKEFVDGACKGCRSIICDNCTRRSMGIPCFHSLGIALWW